MIIQLLPNPISDDVNIEGLKTRLSFTVDLMKNFLENKKTEHHRFLTSICINCFFLYHELFFIVNDHGVIIPYFTR